MALSRRQLWSILSTLYLLVLVSLAAYALHDANALSLPVPNIISALALALPALCGLALETSMSMTTTRRTKPSAHVRPYVLQIVSAVFLVYEAVLATLAGTHLAPAGSLDCALREQWLSLYRSKDASAIKAIQDRYNCCGLASNQDMAWPFPWTDSGQGTDTCFTRYHRERSCLGYWRDAERRVAGILLAVSLAVFVWQMLFLYVGPEQTSPAWLPSTVQLPAGEEGVEHAQDHAGYRDDDDGSEAGGIDATIRRLNADSRLASHIEIGRRA